MSRLTVIIKQDQLTEFEVELKVNDDELKDELIARVLGTLSSTMNHTDIPAIVHALEKEDTQNE